MQFLFLPSLHSHESQVSTEIQNLDTFSGGNEFLMAIVMMLLLL